MSTLQVLAATFVTRLEYIMLLKSPTILSSNFFFFIYYSQNYSFYDG